MRENIRLNLSAVYIYHEDARDAKIFDQLLPYLQSRFPGVPVEEKGHFWSAIFSRPRERGLEVEGIAKRVVCSKVRNIHEPVTSFEPLPGEVSYEMKRLMDPSISSFGILYDGFIFQRILSELLGQQLGLESSRANVVYTHRLLATWDGNDRRYHARVSVYGLPSLISISGLVEAPAKPREYYFLRQRMGILPTDHLGITRLGENLRGKFLVHGDPRLPEVAKGYALQAIFYHLTGDPFCADPDCRLYNAHWQEEMIRAQLKGPYEICTEHQRILDILAHRPGTRIRKEENGPTEDGPGKRGDIL